MHCNEINEGLLKQKEFTKYCIALLLDIEVISDSKELEKQKERLMIECNKFEKMLPMYGKIQEIIETITNHQVTILIGDTESGKSTQLIQNLYGAKIGSDGIIVRTQPRKVAVIALADYVSREMHVKLGKVLGYKVGDSGKFSENTKVLYMTDHTLLNDCIEDQTFSKYSCVIIDEAHERSAYTEGSI